MSDYRDVIKEAIENGILLDKCGLAEKHYDTGSYIDLCGMEPAEILENMRKAGQCRGGGDDEPTKPTVKLSATVASGESGWVVKVTSNMVLPDNVTITVTADGTPNTIIMNAGAIDGISDWTVDKYAEVSATVTPSSTDNANYKVSITNPNGDGVKTISIETYKDNVISSTKTETHKVGTNVTINVPEVMGYDFVNWQFSGTTGTSTKIEFVMPDEDSLVVKLNYAVKAFVIRFLNYDGTTLQSSNVNYGEMPEYTGATPSKPATAQYTYTFDGWNHPVVAVTGDTMYVAQFEATVNQYTVTLSGEHVTLTGAGTYDYGTQVQLIATPEDGYDFTGWSDGVTASTRTVIVNGDMALIANTSAHMYTITYKLDGYADKTKQYTAGETIVDYTASDYNITGATIEWKTTGGTHYSEMPTFDFIYNGTVQAVSGEMYWGQVGTTNFDNLGKTFTAHDLKNILTSTDTGADGNDVEYGVTTSTTYEYVATQADLNAKDAYDSSDLNQEDAEAFQEYVLVNSKYYVVVIPSSILNDATLTIVDDFGGQTPHIIETGYTIDGASYSIVKLMAINAHHIEDWEGNTYSVPETYWGVDLGDMTKVKASITIAK